MLRGLPARNPARLPSSSSSSSSSGGGGGAKAKAKVEAADWAMAMSARRESPWPFLFFFLLLLLGAALSASSPSRKSPGGAEASEASVGCWFVAEAQAGGGSVMPSALSQRRALLLLPAPGGRTTDDDGLQPERLPAEVEAGLAFRVLDPSGTLWGGREPSAAPVWLGADPDSVSCEISAYSPQEAHVSWAVGLVGREGCPRSLERGKWFITTVQSAETGYGVSSILHEEEPSPWKQEGAASSITTTTAVFSVFTRTPQLQSRLGQDVVLDCGFSAPAAPFSVEWRRQHHGAGRVILAYDGTAERVSVAEEGVELLLDPGTNNVSLCLRHVGVHHEGTYICTVYLPHLHVQQAMELKAVAPPRVTLHPATLSVPPSSHAELACEISGFYPLGVSVSWKRKRPGSLPEVIPDSWESGQRQSPDNTFSLTSYVRLRAVEAQDHGASYSCHVTHPGLGDVELHRAVRLRVAGSSGPCLEDAIGLFLVAFGLYGLLQLFFRRATGEKTKMEKLE